MWNRQESGLCPFPLRRARCKHLRVPSLHRTFACFLLFSLSEQTKSKQPAFTDCLNLVRPAGFEPATPWFEAKYSNPLSYGRAGLL